MATRDARSTAWRKHVWWAYLIVGAVVCALYLFVAPLKGSGPVINGLGLSGVVAVLAGIQMNRPSARVPWWCFVLGLFLFWLGDMYTYSYPKLFNVAVPFPSIGDAIYLAVYPALMLGLLALVRRRNRGGDGPGLIDSLIMSVGLALISGVTLIAPYAHDPTMSLLPKLVSIGYPMGDIILLAAAIRLAVDAGKRRPSFYLLTASIVTLLSTDFIYGILTLHGNYHHQLWLDAGWIFFYLLWGAAALHPSMGELDQAAAARQPRLTPAAPRAADRRLSDRPGRRGHQGSAPSRYRHAGHHRRLGRAVRPGRVADGRLGAPAREVDRSRSCPHLSRGDARRCHLASRHRARRAAFGR